ncbi:MAG: alpha/beta hydrolase [Phormidesmis sp. RL_2_1]|nr:alpha/beta hydrolase [Phormidesmis sp. RL_2_1]
MNSTQTQLSLQSPSLQGTFKGANSLKLFYRCWYPVLAEDAAGKCFSAALGPGSATVSETALAETALAETASAESPIAEDLKGQAPIKGVLAIVHGLGEHSGRYCAVVRAMTAAGYAVFAFDNQGHGKSEGQRGHIDRWKDYRDNAKAFLQLVRQQEPTAPLFLMGHSLGGLIVLDYVLRSDQSPQFKALNIAGLVVSAPPIQPTTGTVSAVRIMMARLLSGLFPRLTLKMGLDKSGLSRDRHVTAKMADDPLVHPYVTLRWGSETLDTIAWVKAHIAQLKLPILITHGEADPIIAPAGSCQLFQQIQTPHKTLNLYPGSYHEPHNDLDADVVVTDLVNWVNGRL